MDRRVINSLTEKLGKYGSCSAVVELSWIDRANTVFNKLKKRKNIQPVGFAIDDTTLYLSNSDGKMILADLSAGNIKEIVKVSGDFISRPFIFSQNLFIIRNGSIVQYN